MRASTQQTKTRAFSQRWIRFRLTALNCDTIVAADILHPLDEYAAGRVRVDSVRVSAVLLIGKYCHVMHPQVVAVVPATSAERV